MVLASLLPILLAAASVTADKDHHCVTFTARPTDVNKGTILEFAFVGPDSDRAYEAMFVTEAPVDEIAKAFDAAGIPHGKAVDPRGCRFWPVGNTVSIQPSLADYIEDANPTNAAPIVYTGGRRDAAGYPLAATNMPSAVFALYSLDQSLMQLDNTLDQSVQYGRYICRKKLDRERPMTFTVSWSEVPRTESRTLRLEPGRTREALASLKNGRAPCMDVLLDFSDDLTAAEARAASKALSLIDSSSVRINGFREGQFFFQGFRPNELWRNRAKRLTQPVEIRLNETNVVCTVIGEDWNVEGLDPKLTPRDVPLADVLRVFKGDTCLFYVKPSEKLGRVFAIVRKLPRSIRNWYVFID